MKIYRTIILPIVRHGCETWSFTWREEHRFRVFDMRMAYRVWRGNLREGDDLKDPRGRWKLLSCIFMKWDGWNGVD